jgi:hypothetical protein
VRIALVCSLVLLWAGGALAQGVPIKSGATSDLATVDTNKNMRVSVGPSTRATYTASAGGLVTTALYSMQIEAEVGRGFRIQQICIGTSAATAAALQTVTVRRSTAAGSGGTALPAEGTAALGVAQMVPGTGNWGGRTVHTGTAGTAGALLDTWGWTVPEIAAGTADPGLTLPFCKRYGSDGSQMPTVVAGTANGVSIAVTAAGAGGLASGSISVTFIAE